MPPSHSIIKKQDDHYSVLFGHVGSAKIVYPPTTLHHQPTHPDAELNLKHCHGYSNCGVSWVSGSEYVYANSGVVVVEKSHVDHQSQRYFLGHSTPVACLSFNHQKSIVASGGEGPRSYVFITRVWDQSNLQLLSVLIFHEKRVLACGFSNNGETLVSIGQEDTHQVAIWTAFLPHGIEFMRGFEAKSQTVHIKRRPTIVVASGKTPCSEIAVSFFGGHHGHESGKKSMQFVSYNGCDPSSNDTVNNIKLWNFEQFSSSGHHHHHGKSTISTTNYSTEHKRNQNVSLKKKDIILPGVDGARSKPPKVYHIAWTRKENLLMISAADGFLYVMEGASLRSKIRVSYFPLTCAIDLLHISHHQHNNLSSAVVVGGETNYPRSEGFLIASSDGTLHIIDQLVTFLDGPKNRNTKKVGKPVSVVSTKDSSVTKNTRESKSNRALFNGVPINVSPLITSTHISEIDGPSDNPNLMKLLCSTTIPSIACIAQSEHALKRVYHATSSDVGQQGKIKIEKIASKNKKSIAGGSLSTTSNSKGESSSSSKSNSNSKNATSNNSNSKDTTISDSVTNSSASSTALEFQDFTHKFAFGCSNNMLLIVRYSHTKKRFLLSKIAQIGHTGCITSMSRYPGSGNLVATGCTDGTLRFWSMRDDGSNIRLSEQPSSVTTKKSLLKKGKMELEVIEPPPLSEHHRHGGVNGLELNPVIGRVLYFGNTNNFYPRIIGEVQFHPAARVSINGKIKDKNGSIKNGISRNLLSKEDIDILRPLSQVNGSDLQTNSKLNSNGPYETFQSMCSKVVHVAPRIRKNIENIDPNIIVVDSDLDSFSQQNGQEDLLGPAQQTTKYYSRDGNSGFQMSMGTSELQGTRGLGGYSGIPGWGHFQRGRYQHGDRSDDIQHGINNDINGMRMQGHHIDGNEEGVEISKKLIGDLKNNAGITALAFSESFLAVGFDDGCLRIFSFPSLQPVFVRKIAKEKISTLAFSPNLDKLKLAIGSWDQLIYVIEIVNEPLKLVLVAKLSGNTSSLSKMSFSECGHFLMSNAHDGAILYYDMELYRRCETGGKDFRDLKFLDVMPTSFSTQGIWSSEREWKLSSLRGISKFGKYLITGDDNHSLKLFHYPAYQETCSGKTYTGHGGFVMCVNIWGEGNENEYYGDGDGQNKNSNGDGQIANNGRKKNLNKTELVDEFSKTKNTMSNPNPNGVVSNKNSKNLNNNVSGFPRIQILSVDSLGSVFEWEVITSEMKHIDKTIEIRAAHLQNFPWYDSAHQEKLKIAMKKELRKEQMKRIRTIPLNDLKEKWRKPVILMEGEGEKARGMLVDPPYARWEDEIPNLELQNNRYEDLGRGQDGSRGLQNYGSEQNIPLTRLERRIAKIPTTQQHSLEARPPWGLLCDAPNYDRRDNKLRREICTGQRPSRTSFADIGERG